jgi:PAS domain S-box-containing protein
VLKRRHGATSFQNVILGWLCFRTGFRGVVPGQSDDRIDRLLQADLMAKGSPTASAIGDDDALFGALIATAVDGIIVIDEGGRIQVYSEACVKLFGYRREEVVGNNVKMLMPDPYQSQHDDYLSHYLTTGTKRIIGIGREVQGLRKDGSTFPMYLSVGEGKIQDQRIFVGIVHDITVRISGRCPVRSRMSSTSH